MHRRLLATLAAALALAAGACSEEDNDQRAASARPDQAPAASPPPPPDAGTRAGHGADVSPTVEVPGSDATPPEATITLSAGGTRLGSVSQPPRGAHATVVELRRPQLRGTTVGRDADGGVARVRVSIKERITCRRESTTFTRLRTRYFPPPQVERVRSTPGAVLPTRRVRTLELRVGHGRCGSTARAHAIRGELWGEAVNGNGLEAVTPHIRFRAAAG